MATGAKGVTAEEALRNYFRNTGYFVVRGIPLNYKGFDITDVDLWLYAKATSLTSERICVDVKNRRTPQAMERVLWTKGLKEILRVDRAIVVTSDNRPETRSFGIAHNVGILQGDFLQNVIATFPSLERITEEELFSLLKARCVIDHQVEWRNKYRLIKAKLLDNLNFDGCNSFLQTTKLLLDEYIATSKSSEISIRLLYIAIAYFLICLDYTVHSFVSLDTASRALILTAGFRYGEMGRKRSEEIIQKATQLLFWAGKTTALSGESLRNEIERQWAEYRVDILSEHFAKTESIKNLFANARGFEEQAYSRTLLHPHECSSEKKAIIGLICDLLGHDRKMII